MLFCCKDGEAIKVIITSCTNLLLSILALLTGDFKLLLFFDFELSLKYFSALWKLIGLLNEFIMSFGSTFNALNETMWKF